VTNLPPSPKDQARAQLTGAISKGQYDQALAEDIAQFYDDPYGFVMYVFPWGQPGTELEDFDGPDKWQAELLIKMRDHLRADPMATIQSAIASGHGIGKGAQTSWIVLWAMSTRPHLAGWVTANTQSQLKGKTWRELSVWHKRSLNEHWFNWTATRFYQKDNPETWGIDAIPWTEHNSEAFAGLHAQHVLMVMDEASGIADQIWEVAEGAMTTPRAMWFVFGNPTRNTGRFRECFGKYRHRWWHRNIDSRTCKMTNKVKLKEWEEDHGEDSDFFRVRVRGMFPKQASNQLISSEIVENARNNRLEERSYVYQPILIGCDPARFGDDEAVITARQGRKQHVQKGFRGLDNMQLGAMVARMFNEFRERGYPMGAIFVDGIGLGSGVVDYLNTLGYPVIDVNVGKAAESPLYYNKRVECWVRLKEWLEAGADIVDDPVLAEQLIGPTYRILPTKDQLMLERKEEMKARGLDSPDRAEALALTFAEPFVWVANSQAHANYGVGAGSFDPEVV
jgi:hypothetical protein